MLDPVKISNDVVGECSYVGFFDSVVTFASLLVSVLVNLSPVH